MEALVTSGDYNALGVAADIHHPASPSSVLQDDYVLRCRANF